MARKPRFFEPVADPASDDAAEPTEGRGRSARKRASHELRRLGEELITRKPAEIAALGLPERLEEALAEARRLTSFGAQRRQAQFIGKLMRQLDEESIAAIRKALQRP